MDTVLAALADPIRRGLLDLLVEHDGASAATLAAGLPVSRQAVVRHLVVLAAAGLVAGGRVGHEVRYTLRTPALDAAARRMALLAAEWHGRLAGVRASPAA